MPTTFQNGDAVVPAGTSRMPRELLAAGLFLAAILVLATHYHALPPCIPSPFNHGGDRNGMAGKDQLWLLLFLAAWVYFLLSLLNLFGPENLNGPMPLSADRRILLLRRCQGFMGWFKIAFSAALLVVIYRLCTQPR